MRNLVKRTIILRLYTYVCPLLFFAVFGVFFLATGKIFPAWFSLTMLIIGSWSLLKAIFFSIDSNFWLAIFLIFIGIVGIINAFAVLKQENLFAFYFLAPVYASFFTGIFYKNLLHYYISFLLLLEDFLILLYSNKILMLYSFIGTNIILLTIIIGGIYVHKRNKRLQQKGGRQKD